MFTVSGGGGLSVHCQLGRGAVFTVSIYLCVLELLFNILDDSLTVETDECARDEFGVDGVGSYNLTCDLQQTPNFCRCEVTNPKVQTFVSIIIL